MIKKFTICFVSLIASLLCAVSNIAHAQSFNQNSIIDQSIFDNANAMTASEIDIFLNSFPNSCISPNSGFKAIDPTGYNPTSGFSYGGYVTAGQVLYDAAQAYNINPQVLVATLQKEQSLVAGAANYCENGDYNKYAAAAGYGCPDGGVTYSYTNVNLYQRNGVAVTSTGQTCVNSAAKAGFSQQIIRAAWLLKFGEERSEGNINWAVIRGSWDNSDDPQSCYDGPMTQGTYQRCPSGSSTYYDGYTTIDGVAVHMDNGPTAALYWYTPHLSGNQSFYNIFTSWFGPTDNGSPIYQDATTSQLFMVWGDTKYYIPTFDILDAWGLKHYSATSVTDTYLSGLSTGPDLTNLVKMTSDPNSPLFLLDDGKRYPIPSSACAFDLQGNPVPNTSWALDCYNTNVVKSYPDLMIERYTVQDMTLPQMIANNNAVWKIEGGKKRLIVDPLIIDVLGGWANVRWMENVNAQQPVGKMLMRNGWVVRFSGTDTVYLYDNNQLLVIPSPDILVAWGLQNQIHDYPASNNATDPLPLATNFVSRIAEDGNNSFYLMDYGYKLPLGSATAQWPTNSATLAPGIVPAIPAIPLSTVYRSDADGEIFTVYNSRRYVFPTMDDFYALGFNPMLIRGVSGSVENLPGLSYGGMHLASGRLYKVSNDPNQIYLVQGSTSLYVNSINYPNLPYSKLITVDPITAARYPVAGTYQP